jgi:hypothetical protein
MRGIGQVPDGNEARNNALPGDSFPVLLGPIGSSVIRIRRHRDK